MPNPSIQHSPLILPIPVSLMESLADGGEYEATELVKSQPDNSLAALVAAHKLAASPQLPPQIKLQKIIATLAEDLQENPPVRDILLARLVAARWDKIKTTLEAKGVHWEQTETKSPYRKRTEFINSIQILGQHENEEQEMIAYLARRNDDEPMNISGYAGVGKTTMIQRLAHEFDDKRTVVLCRTPWQRNILAKKAPEKVKILTVDLLCKFIIDNNNPETMWGNRYNAPYDFNVYIRELGITSMNGLSPAQVASILGQQIFNFCESLHNRIENHHFPVDLLLSYTSFSIEEVHSFPVDQYTEMARQLWRRIKSKTPDSELAITPKHALKIIDQYGAQVSGWINKLIIDESHDLSPIFSSIVKRSDQRIISLGDEYQITDLKPRLTLDEPSIREKTICESQRTGYNLSDVFNSVLQEHTRKDTLEPFTGTRTKNTQLIAYDDFELPDRPCTILTDEVWYVVLAMHQLAGLGRPFCLMKETKGSIRKFVRQALNAYKGEKVVFKYHDLISYDDWTQFVMERGHTNGLIQLDQLFRKGFTYQKWEQLLSLASPAYKPGQYVIGQDTESKSLEFSNVLLAPDLVNRYKIDDAPTIEDRTRQLNKIYTSLSRATNRIYLPRREGAWLFESLS